MLHRLIPAQINSKKRKKERKEDKINPELAELPGQRCRIIRRGDHEPRKKLKHDEISFSRVKKFHFKV